MPQPTTAGRALAMVAAVAHFMLLHLRAAMRAGHTAQWWAHYCWLSMFGLCQLELPYGITSCSLLCMQAQYVPCAAVHNVGSPWAGRLTCCLKQTEVHAIPCHAAEDFFLECCWQILCALWPVPQADVGMQALNRVRWQRHSQLHAFFI